METKISTEFSAKGLRLNVLYNEEHSMNFLYFYKRETALVGKTIWLSAIYFGPDVHTFSGYMCISLFLKDREDGYIVDHEDNYHFKISKLKQLNSTSRHKFMTAIFENVTYHKNFNGFHREVNNV